MKRTVQVNVKMSPEDFQLLKKAAAKKWPDAVMTNSGIVLGLAKITASDVLGKGKRWGFTSNRSSSIGVRP
jgi:hypothetical protein